MSVTDQALVASPSEIEHFVRALFRYADSGTYVSLRSFDQFDRGAPARLIRSVRINGSLDPVIAAATEAATASAASGNLWVFCPPICTFTNGQRARGEDLANGVAISVEIDEGDIAAARTKLEAILGPATLAIASGSDWIDETTGVIQPKMHLHWRLSEPTRIPEDHAKLGLARDLATRLIGADPTGKPIVHPLRWPGSWNLKGTPILAHGVSRQDEAEVHLAEAVDALAEAADAIGMASTELPRSAEPEAATSLLASAMAAIPNPGVDVHYDVWIRFGYALWRASGGSDIGQDIWDEWSKKSDKYDAIEQDAAWTRIGRAIERSSAPRTIGAGTIFFYAMSNGWVRPALGLFEPKTEIPDFVGAFQWQAGLAVSAKGIPQRTLRNTLVALRNAYEWRDVFAWNEFSNRITLRREMPTGPAYGVPRELTEVDISNTTDWMQRQDIVIGSAISLEAIRTVSEESRYHPVREYLDSLEWDGIERINHWLSDHMGCEDTALHHAFGSRWLIGLVARVMDPGCQMDTALILESRQGLKKSSALRALAEPWFTDHLPDLTHKDAQEQLQGVWLVELAELSSLNRAETHKVKSFLTTRFDRFRPSYGKIALDHPRQCGFAGTINPGSNGYLRDETGARRFWTVECGVEWDDRQQVDIDGLKAVRDQLWAEATFRFRNEAVWWLDNNDLEIAQAEAAEERSDVDALETLVQSLLSGRTSATMEDILGENGLKIPPERWTRSLQIQLGFVLKRIGWEKKRPREGGGEKRSRRYYPVP